MNSFGSKVLSILIPLGAFVAFILFVVSSAPLPSSKALTVALNNAPISYELMRIDVKTATLFCDKSKKVGASFEYRKEEGRAPVTVVGSTPCQDTGPMVVWTLLKTRAREEYMPAMVASEVASLANMAKLEACKDCGFNEELNKRLNNKYQGLIVQKNFKHVEFTCEEAGDPFKFYASYDYPEKDLGTVKTRCMYDNERFSISPPNPRTLDGEKDLGYVMQYRKISATMVESAYGEFLNTPEFKKSF